jgi:hypothetical protein
MRPTDAELEQIHHADARAARPLDPSERRAELIIGGSAALVAAGLWLLPSAGHWSAAAGVCVIALLAASCIRVDVGGGFTAPVQLGFLPLIFTVPANAVPAIVIAVLALSRVPAVLRAQSSPARLLLSFGNGWFAIGASVLLLAVGGSGALLRHPLLGVALLAAQVATDFAASTLRDALSRGASVGEQLWEARWVYGLDAALAPAPLWIVAATGKPALAAAILLPSLLLARTYAVERRRHIDALLVKYAR